MNQSFANETQIDKFYFVVRFQTPRDYFGVNAGRVQISSMQDVSV